MVLLTVLIGEKEHIDAIRQENKLFFEPFLKNKELAFCYWNPAGQNLSDSVPGLVDAVGREKRWRAVIINNVDETNIKARNPFDTVDRSALEQLAEPEKQPGEGQTQEEWEKTWQKYYELLTAAKDSVYRNSLTRPLQKLATWLCFRPEEYVLNDVQEKKDEYDWAMEMIAHDEVKAVAVLEHLERMQYKAELRLRENIRREFVGEKYLNIAYPTEMQCISVRTAESNFFDPDAYWSIHRESEYSEFADRNLYFDKMRFMVCDLLPETHRNYRTDYIRFLATVLIFASNPIPGSAMQARRLYRLETETDDTPLCTLVTSYDKKLQATSEVIDSEMERIRGEIPSELTDKDAEALFCTAKDIPVLLDDSCKPEKVLVDMDYGLFFDSPENEFYKWNKDFKVSEREFAYIAKQRSRAVRKSVSQTQISGDMSDINVSRLTPLQIEDIRDFTDAAENEMIDSIPPDITDTSVYTKRMAEASENVRKEIGRRMTKKTAFILSAVCLGIYLICFLPFWFANGGNSRTVSTAVIFTMVMMGIMAVTMIVALILLRLPIVNAIRCYNNTVRELMDDVKISMERFSKYLSACFNVRKGHFVCNYAEKNLDEYTKSLRIRKKHKEDIRKRRAHLEEEYGDYFGDSSCCDETMARPYEYDFDMRTEYDYPAPFLAGDCRQIEFISGGNLVEVPSSYVKKIMVRMEEIYEK